MMIDNRKEIARRKITVKREVWSGKGRTACEGGVSREAVLEVARLSVNTPLMQSSYLGFFLVVSTCLIGISKGQGVLPIIDPSEGGEDKQDPQTLQIFKVPERKCPEGQQRLNGICRTVFTNKQKTGEVEKKP